MSSTIGSSLLTFRQIDADGSGALSLAEFRQGQALASSSLRQAVKVSGIESVFNQFDTDGNSSLSSSELAVGLQQLAAESANALLDAQQHMSLNSVLATSLATQLYGTLGGLSGGATNLTTSILGAYYAA